LAISLSTFEIECEREERGKQRSNEGNNVNEETLNFGFLLNAINHPIAMGSFSSISENSNRSFHRNIFGHKFFLQPYTLFPAPPYNFFIS